MPGSAARLIALSGLTVASSLTLAVTAASAQLVQARATSARPVTIEASMRSGMVVGLVTDDRGDAVPGVAVTAIGTTQAQAKTDGLGQFRLPLVPGDYILRASREGYVSPYREQLRIRAASQVERNIKMVRDPGLADRRRLLATTGLNAGLGDPLPVASVVRPDDKEKNESLQAWYLRFLPRTVLRDGGNGRVVSSPERADFRYLPSFLDWAVVESARAATAFFGDTDFSGQFNMLTTSALSPAATWDAQMPRGIAYLAVGAPVGTHGDWRLRGALSTGGLTSWVALGEYEARDVQTHAFKVGMSYGAQRYADHAGASILKSGEHVRAAASVYAIDRFQVNRAVQFDLGIRADRYDYVSQRNFFSPRLGVRVAVLPRTYLTARGSSAVVAPGMDAFLPPTTSGPWLPPDRTFASLVPGAALTPERVHQFEVGAMREFGPISHTRTLSAQWFYEHTDNQLSTLFGLDASRGVGHYYVATAGDVTLQGVRVGASGWFTSRVEASVNYSLGHATWVYGPQAQAIANVSPSGLRPMHERLHDVTSTLRARIPETDTSIQVAYRVNSAFSRPDAHGIEPMFDGRFDVQLRQALPYQPIRGGKIEVLVSMNNLFRDPADAGAFGGSFYDELLSVRAPRRVLGGVQVRF